MARSKKKTPTPPPSEHDAWHDVIAISLIGAGLVTFMALLSYDPKDLPSWVSFSVADRPQVPIQNFIGPLGALFAGYSFFVFGAAAYFVPAGMIWFGVSKLLSGFVIRWQPLVGFAIFLVSGACLLQIQTLFLDSWRTAYKSLGPGGGIGYLVGDLFFANVIGRMGATMVALISYMVGLVMMTGVHPMDFFLIAKEATGNYFNARQERKEARLAEALADLETVEEKPKRKRVRKTATAEEADDLGADDGEAIAKKPGKKGAKGKKKSKAEPDLEDAGEVEDGIEFELGFPVPQIFDSSAPPEENDEKKPSLAEVLGRRKQEKRKENPAPMGSLAAQFADYKLPEIDILDPIKQEHSPANKEHLLETQNTIVRTLGTFGVPVTPGDITRGPAITRFEIYPDEGMRVSRITALEADLARATRAERINILAPVPGKDTVGIEIANKIKVAVPLRELLESEEFHNEKWRIPLALGKDVYGKTIIGDLAAMPHLLVAGATGSGKSVCINSIIASLLYQFGPDELRFIMIDPKVVEMQNYNDLPHLVIPVVTDPKKVILALRWVVKEMERRYQIFAKEGVRNHESFNNREANREAADAARAAKAAKADAAGEKHASKTSPVSKRIQEAKRKAAERAARAATGTAAMTMPVVTGKSTSGGSGFGEEEPAGVPFDPDGVPFDDYDDVAFDGSGAGFGGGKPNGGSGKMNTHHVHFDHAGEHDYEPPEREEHELEIPDTLPYIVVIIDELADLMQTAPADVELAIARITQMARAAGIHLIVATQTPRADVITGVIKANIPSRIAFQVASALDSRVILDSKGAERLVGKGDMLYVPPGSSQMTRAQGALITDEEIFDLVNYCKTQGEPVFEEEIQDTLEGGDGGEGDDVSPEDEETLQRCIEVIQQEKRASTSLLQRRLRLGYTRAARMIDVLEMRGIIGPGDGAKPREILVDLSDPVA